MRELRQSWRNTKLVANSLWRSHRANTPFPIAFDRGLGLVLDEMQNPNSRNRRAAARQVVEVTGEYRTRVRAAPFPVPEIARLLLQELDAIDARTNL